MKASKVVKTVLVSSPLFLAGCNGCRDPYYDRRYNDGVPVIVSPQAGYHYSTYYGGYVPIFVPIGGFRDGRTYEYHYYHDVPERDRRQYTAPSAVPRRPTVTSSPNSTSAGAPTKPNTGPSITPGVKRGIAGGIGAGVTSGGS